MDCCKSEVMAPQKSTGEIMTQRIDNAKLKLS